MPPHCNRCVEQRERTFYLRVAISDVFTLGDSVYKVLKVGVGVCEVWHRGPEFIQPRKDVREGQLRHVNCWPGHVSKYFLMSRALWNTPKTSMSPSGLTT